MTNWIRTFRILIGKAGQTGFEISDNGEGRAIHVSFSISKSSSNASNSCKLQIWNMSEAHKSVLREKKTVYGYSNVVVEIRAGYNGNNYPLFVGNVSNTTESADGTDRYMEIELVDGRYAFQTKSSISFAGVIDCKTVADKFVTDMGLPSMIYTENAKKKLSETKYDNGFAYVGKSKEGFASVCSKCGLKWSLQNQIMQVYEPNEAITRQAYVLDKSSGLVGVPNRVKLDSDGYEVYGYEIEYLMNGAIGVNDYVRIKSAKLDGFFKIRTLSIDGDNYGGDWVCKAQVVEVKR